MVKRSTQLNIPPSWFSDWYDPARFFGEVSAILESIPSGRLFVGPEYQDLFDAFAAGRFAVARRTSEVCLLRMERDRFPDFALKLGDRIEQFEFTEADRAGRRRGEEYQRRAERSRRGLPNEPELFDPTEDVAAALEAIARVIKAKARKHYQPKPNLLVLVTLAGFEWPPDREAELIELTRPWRHGFESIWLLWGAHVFRAWPTPLKLTVPPAGHGHL